MRKTVKIDKKSGEAFLREIDKKDSVDDYEWEKTGNGWVRVYKDRKPNEYQLRIEKRLKELTVELECMYPFNELGLACCHRAINELKDILHGKKG